jgi:hypothetical protein
VGRNSRGLEEIEVKLCYVAGGFAYFTSQDLKDQWGDDWDDAPYECNAGPPYTGDDWQIVKMAYDGEFETPEENYRIGYISVKDINAGAIPWLSDSYKNIHIYAGTSIEEFKNRIRMGGGNVYVKQQA